MTQYEQLVQDTAEKMAAISYTHFGTASKTLQDHWTMTMYPAAELAVAMKVEGFDEGVRSAKDNYFTTAPDEIDTVSIEFLDDDINKDKFNLGLTKPTQNEQ